MLQKATKAALLLLLLAVCSASAALSQEVNASGQAAGRRLSDQLLKSYLSHPQLGAWMDEFVARCGIGRKFSIGKSGSGADLWVLEVSDKPGVDEPEPSFKYIANMHGDETSGRMLLPMLAEWLCANNGKDDRATRLVRDTHLFLMPTMNPDGFAAQQRGNQRGVDLNRNFPDPIRQKGLDLRQPMSNTQPETKAVMAFTLSRNFTASANLHEGAVVVNYPYDGYTASWAPQGTLSQSPDDATFRFLSRTYADKHAFMAKSQEFEGGITNGAAWYDVYGGMQDWNYAAAGDMEVTLELNQEKFPPASELPKIWEENRDALLALPLAATLGGVRGRVKVAGTDTPILATLYSRPATGPRYGSPIPFYSGRAFGEYARPLAPGRHVVTATAEGYQPAEAEVEVPEGGAGAVLDFELKPANRG